MITRPRVDAGKTKVRKTGIKKVKMKREGERSGVNGDGCKITVKKVRSIKYS